jgi:uncharacterized protein (TIGR00297 family)
MTLVAQLALGVALSGFAAWAGYRRGALSRNGAAGAVMVGTVIWGLGGWPWGVVLIAFFVLSSLLSHYKATAKVQVAEQFSKGSRRDLGQALANGGLGALLAMAYAIYPTSILWTAFAGAMAAVNADTWATELGVLSRNLPRLITTGRRVERGTSGAISLLGSMGALAGAFIIGAIAVFCGRWGGLQAGASQGLALLSAATFGGAVGTLCDSLLGATAQRIYYSPARHKETERRIDPDGTLNTPLRGWPWMDNDMVNLLSSIVGALTATVVWLVLLWGSLL